jgi:hypothetical protein
MRLPQLLIWEGDDRLATLLRPLAEERKWSLRQPRQQGHCLALLRRSGPTVLVLKVGRDLERELILLERAPIECPGVAVVVVGDATHAPLIGPAWDLGADYVHFPPESRDTLPEIVAGLMGPTDG